ncbi:hypothetical protein ACIQUM_20775 [Amycolatopsis azurea]|uniref:hypothetical protein n=1 Tax=Amycolatopsis azurea TaxID=36819 RepID=UPI00381E863A
MKLVASVAALTGLMLTGCDSGNDESAGSKNHVRSTKGATGTYLSITEGQHGNVVVVDGTKITYLSLSASDSKKCSLLNKAFADIDDGKIAAGGKSSAGMYEIESTGTIVDDQTSVIWDDDNGADGSGSKTGTGSLSVNADTVTLEYIFHMGASDDVLVPRDSAQGKAVVAKYCG